MAEYGPVVEGLEVGKTYKLVVPQKLPLGGSVKGQRKPGLFRVYVPTRDGGELTLETSAGEIEVRDPDGQAAVDAEGKAVAKGKKVAFELPLGKHGWYGVAVSGAASYELSSKFKIAGHSRDADGSMLVPWHFYYWAYTGVESMGQGHPAAKWDKKFNVGAYDWESVSYFKSAIDANNLNKGGLEGHSITGAFCNEVNEHFNLDDQYKYSIDSCGWWGHCDAASAASGIFTQPQNVGDLNENDLEWAATEIAMCGYMLEEKFFLGLDAAKSLQFPRSHQSHKDVPSEEEGQSVDKSIAAFHDALVKTIKQEGAITVVDFRANVKEGDDSRHSHVWNQAVYRFEAEVEQAEEDGPGKDEEGLARCVRVKTVLHANADKHPSSGNPESPAGSGWYRDVHYVLNYDQSGKPDLAHPKNNVTKVCRGDTKYYMPRYIFRIKGLGGSNNRGNPKVTLADLASVGVTQRKLFGG